MEIHTEELSDVKRYIEKIASKGLSPERRQQFQNLIRYVSVLKAPGPETRMLEIGTGAGWFPIQCLMAGYPCEGIEISTQLIETAKQLGAKYGVEPKIRLGNLEDNPFEKEAYDIIVASSVFEHVEHWKPSLRYVYDALKPGGVLFFESTNKFSFSKGEHWFPLYGWFPDPLRYRLRMLFDGADIMKLGIDFHQFRYPQLRREFERVGFRTILDRVQVAQPEWASDGMKRRVLTACKNSSVLRHLVLTFFPATTFVCQK